MEKHIRPRGGTSDRIGGSAFDQERPMTERTTPTNGPNRATKNCVKARFVSNGNRVSEIVCEPQCRNCIGRNSTSCDCYRQSDVFYKVFHELFLELIVYSRLFLKSLIVTLSHLSERYANRD